MAGRELAEAVCHFPPFQDAQVIAAFASFGNEIPTDELLLKLRDDGRTLLLPRTKATDSSMVFCEFSHLDQLPLDRFGIRSPDGEPFLGSVDLVLMPGLCFGMNGGRIGYGAGFYDRFLGAQLVMPPRCGLGFSFQVVDQVDLEHHDVPLTHVATPNGVLACAA